MPKISFKGIFLDEHSTILLKQRGHLLENPKQEMHITLALGDDPLVPDVRLGEYVSVIVDGEAGDENNHGYRIKLPGDIEVMYKNIETRIPHITVSLSNEGKPKDTKNLPFEDIVPFSITGRIGMMMSDGTLVFKRSQP